MSYDKVEEFYEFGPGRHDFYRCIKCQTLFTQQYERERMLEMSQAGDGNLFIHCTSLRYQPAVPYFYEWLYPWVTLYAIKVLLARVVAPWAENRKHFWLYRLALRLAGNKTTRGEDVKGTDETDPTDFPSLYCR